METALNVEMSVVVTTRVLPDLFGYRSGIWETTAKILQVYTYIRCQNYSKDLDPFEIVLEGKLYPG